MKPKSPASLDFRTTITAEIDMVLTAKARVLGVDKAAVARDVLARWAADEIGFAQCLAEEEKKTEERELRAQIQRKQINRRTQNAVYARDGFKCKECGEEPGPEKLQVDHIIPVTAGGSNELSNLRVLCEDCNRAKSNKIVSIK